MHDHGDKSAQRLAAAIIVAAVKDYKRGLKRGDRELCREAKQFLLRGSLWHVLAGIRPEKCAQWIYQQSAK